MGQLEKILLIEQDGNFRFTLTEFIKSRGYEIQAYGTVDEAAYRAKEYKADVILADVQSNAGEFISKVKAFAVGAPIILIAEQGHLSDAVEAIKAGAFNYVLKPFKPEDIEPFIKLAIQHSRLQSDNSTLRQSVQGSWKLEDQGLLGKSPAMQKVFDLIKRVSQSDASVLLVGPSGSGKEAIARAIHSAGPRADKPFIAINCSLAPAILEGDLFGTSSGSFTGAYQTKKGSFLDAESGTLFLDEIAELSPQLQTKLLKVLQEKKIRSLGGNEDVSFDVRIIAASPSDLKKAVADGKFNEELFYQLSVVTIEIPKLQDRQEDIPLLAQNFLRKHAAVSRSTAKTLSPGALKKLMSRNWTGNVRELENVIERALVLTQGREISENEIMEPQSQSSAPGTSDASMLFTDYPTLDELEKRYMKVVLEKTKGRKERAAKILGINRRTLYRKEREYGWVAADAAEEANKDQPSQLSH